jgi:hypothetical protein
MAAGFFAAVVARSMMNEDAPDQRTLFVSSTPAGATILVDGERVGVTPAVVDLRLGDGAHTLKLAVPNGPDGQLKFSLKKDERFKVVNENLLHAGKVVVETRPPGARILMDATEVGTSPLTLEKVSTSGTHVLEARLEGYTTQTMTIPQERGETWNATLTLPSTRGTGSVVLEAHPQAELFMDGQPWGKTGGKERSCPVGQHEITLQAPGVPRPATYTVEVPEKGTARYFFDLRGL